ncbi:MAG: hypothetical protein WAZ98_04425 [Cyclobacteriaceae bacterium]
MNKIYFSLLLPIYFLLGAGITCESEFVAEHSLKSKNGDYSIVLKLKKGNSARYEFELQDLNTGKFVAKKSESFIDGESKTVFDKVSPSTYTVYFTSSDCPKKKSIKGTGIVLE